MVIVMEEKGRSKKDTVNALHAVAAEMHDRMMRGVPPRKTLTVAKLFLQRTRIS